MGSPIKLQKKRSCVREKGGGEGFTCVCHMYAYTIHHMVFDKCFEQECVVFETLHICMEVLPIHVNEIRGVSLISLTMFME